MSNNQPPLSPFQTQWLPLTLFTVVVFAGDQVTRKLAIGSMPRMWTVSVVFSIAATALWILALYRRSKILPKETSIWWSHILSGCLYAGLNYVGLTGLKLTTASRAGVLVYSYPLFVTLFSTWGSHKESVSRQQLSGLGLAFLGILFLFKKELLNLNGIKGDLLVLLSAIILAYMIVHLKAVSQKAGSEATALWQLTFSLPLCWVGAWLLEARPDWASLPQAAYVSLVYQGLAINVIGALFRSELVRINGAARISTFFFFTPFLTMLFSYYVLKETLEWQLFVGALIVVIGVWVSLGGTSQLQKISSIRPLNILRPSTWS